MTNYFTLTEIKLFLDHGDMKKIARKAGYTEKRLREGSNYVSKVLNGSVPANGYLAKAIIKSAGEIAEINQLHGKTANLKTN